MESETGVYFSFYKKSVHLLLEVQAHMAKTDILEAPRSSEMFAAT